MRDARNHPYTWDRACEYAEEITRRMAQGVPKHANLVEWLAEYLVTFAGTEQRGDPIYRPYTYDLDAFLARVREEERLKCVAQHEAINTLTCDQQHQIDRLREDVARLRELVRGGHALRCTCGDDAAARVLPDWADPRCREIQALAASSAGGPNG